MSEISPISNNTGLQQQQGVQDAQGNLGGHAVQNGGAANVKMDIPDVTFDIDALATTETVVDSDGKTHDLSEDLKSKKAEALKNAAFQEQPLTNKEKVEVRLASTLTAAENKFNGGQTIPNVLGGTILTEVEIDAADKGSSPNGAQYYGGDTGMDMGVQVNGALRDLPDGLARDFGAVHEMSHILQPHVADATRADIGNFTEIKQGEVFADLTAVYLMMEDGVSKDDLVQSITDNADALFGGHSSMHPTKEARLDHITSFLNRMENDGDSYYVAIKKEMAAVVL